MAAREHTEKPIEVTASRVSSANPQIGRAEALGRSVAELVTKGASRAAHPVNWAPFVLVGEGLR